MAIKTIQVATDDFDGTEAADVETRTFIGHDGETYEMELSDSNWTTLQDAIREATAPYMAKARKPEVKATGNGKRTDRDENARIREAWNKAHPSEQLDGRGRVPNKAREWFAAHSGAQVPAEENAGTNGAESKPDGSETPTTTGDKPNVPKPRAARTSRGKRPAEAK